MSLTSYRAAPPCKKTWNARAGLRWTRGSKRSNTIFAVAARAEGGMSEAARATTTQMKRTVQIYDTTLRDGTQAEGISFSLVDKLRIAEKLDQFGVAYIEGGWPGSNPKDADFFIEAAKRKFKTAKIAAFGSTRKAGAKCADDP